MNRRQSLQKMMMAGMAISVPSLTAFGMTQIQRRIIPSTKEPLPIVGLGTWQTFDVGTSNTEREPLKEVLKTLVSNGASVIDSSPMYGNSEAVVGDLSKELGVNEKLFIATKVWTSGKENGIRQMENSFKLLKRDKVDLLQIHNLVDWQTHLKTLREWKEKGRIRYIGLTHYTASAHDTLESIISNNEIDFIQINYSVNSRNAEKSLLPKAAEKNIAALVNRPFEEGALFNKVKGKPLPEWASEFDCNSWGQVFLKFILSNPHVTCVIPGTAKSKHLIDNLGAGMGKLPDEKQRQLIINALR
ncbi:aldo/keto reductase [Chryseosolibacter indicus]|uniref:Aldo/keto reductase n=1 Tax=Chryseosolibacter indicus TaxID=2782351 RepID=A0ABS5VY64_9BACT|nr:aldo/keto reductase [Chryseosolibacter indicus]MBT1705694.1 aldo/keto reductase [Chryseosolibacter indicus]